MLLLVRHRRGRLLGEEWNEDGGNDNGVITKDRIKTLSRIVQLATTRDVVHYKQDYCRFIILKLPPGKVLYKGTDVPLCRSSYRLQKPLICHCKVSSSCRNLHKKLKLCVELHRLVIFDNKEKVC